MQCRNHAAVGAASNCAGCSEPFCSQCVVLIRGQPHCAACKKIAVPGPAPPPPIHSRKLLGEARIALILSIVGLLCGFILEPVALAKAAEAKRLLSADPALDGRGMVVACRIIALIGLLLWTLAVLARILGRD